MSKEMPLSFVHAIYPNYFLPRSQQPARPDRVITPVIINQRKRQKCGTKTPLFSQTKATQYDIMSSATVQCAEDPASMVKYRLDNGHIVADYMRPFNITTPPMVTCFPKLVPEISHNSYDDTSQQGPPNRPPEIDLTMKGAGPEQNNFKAFMDRLDDALLDFVCANQQVLGKVGLKREHVEMMMKRQFRPRVSVKTGKSYPDAQTCRYKSKESPLQLVDSSCNPIDLTANPTAVGYNDIVRVGMRYNGAYVRGGTFGNSWEMLCVQLCGHADNAPQCEAQEYFQGSPLDQSSWPSLQN